MKKNVVPQRKRIFIAVEGESEPSFIKWIQQLSDQQGLHIHLDCQALGGGGYKTMLEKTIRERKRKERHRAKFSILLVDSDRADYGDDGWTLTQLQKYALDKNIIICTQRPNLEGLLLRMLSNSKKLQPQATKTHHLLNQAWRDYKKPADARTLAAKFSFSDLLRAAHVDSELKTLLSIIGFFTITQ